MRLSFASTEARVLCDECFAELSARPFEELVTQTEGRTERSRVKAPSGRQYEVMTAGSFDHPTDRTSFYYVWIYVRPAWVARIPAVRWLLSARATLIPN